jgi:hypothetical protein
MKMSRFITLMALILSFGTAAASSLTEDITKQGVESWFWKNVTPAMVGQSIQSYEDVTAANTLTYAECGKTMTLNATAEFASTLPTPVAGCSFKFIVQAAPVGTAYTIVTSGGANIIDGTTVVNGGVIGCVNEDTITFTASAAISGDWVELWSDGTNWFVTGQAFAATGIACTAT